MSLPWSDRYSVAIPWPSSTLSAVSKSSRVFPWGRGEPDMASTFILFPSLLGNGLLTEP